MYVHIYIYTHVCVYVHIIRLIIVSNSDNADNNNSLRWILARSPSLSWPPTACGTSS